VLFTAVRLKQSAPKPPRQNAIHEAIHKKARSI
jgi:hypothetical protein